MEGYKIQAGPADAQRFDVAINEAVRPICCEKVDMLLGFYSSAECVPAAARIEEFQKFMWITTCIASPVLRDRHLKYVFRPQPYGTQWGLASTDMLAAYSKAQLGKDPKDLRVAIIHGTDVARAMSRVRDKGRHPGRGQRRAIAVTAPDLSSLVTKLKRAARRDLHTIPNPDINMFLRQARELGLHFDALVVGHLGPECDRQHRDQTGCRQRRQLLLRRRSDLDLGHQPEVAEAGVTAADPDDR